MHACIYVCTHVRTGTALGERELVELHMEERVVCELSKISDEEGSEQVVLVLVYVCVCVYVCAKRKDSQTRGDCNVSDYISGTSFQICFRIRAYA